MNKISKRPFFLEEELHSWNKSMLHASRIKKLQPKIQSFLLSFKICNFIKKKTFSGKKKFRLVLWPEKYRFASKEEKY